MIEQNSFVSGADREEVNTATSEPSNANQEDARGAGSDAKPRRQHGSDPRNSGGHKQNDRQGQGQGHGKNNRQNNKFNKKAKKKPRWQKGRPNRVPREEASGLEIGELPEFELFEDLDAVSTLALELASGGAEPLNFNRLYDLPLPELREEAGEAALNVPAAPSRDQLIHAFIQSAAEKKSAILTEGVLDLLEDAEGGLLVYMRDSYRQRALSAFVPQALIKKYGLQQGHIIKAQLHPRRENESCPFVVAIQEVMGREPASVSEIVPFTERVPYYPTSRILLETGKDSSWDNLSMRVVDCLTPIGFGQRGLIVAPPRTGKTVLLQSMANAIQHSYPDAHLIVLLIDERPEEVTDFLRQCTGEVVSSTFDESAESHVHAAEMVIAKARRMVEVGQDVVILLDSITRLARAYNTMMPNSGKILSGGVEANALQRPKRFFGSARNIEDGGSLTILGTALVETGSKMDEVIFEEFKGTGNMELHLDRGLSDKRIFPALNMEKSGTRKEELLYHPDEMNKIYALRRAMKGIPSVDAMEMLIQRIKKTNSNAEFLMSVSK
ncbi:MAG: transcription termination factor Rho [Puniceicoccaceae bacterium MED-G30]|nr:MAG: transcription termination factor Rho [Puniceicoccaceae bacterium MED-G30]RPG84232.1 MAG: transcription termination factor Rho [Coraliomargarita sp. TMED73]